jgi:hypothetical protein
MIELFDCEIAKLFLIFERLCKASAIVCACDNY